MKEQAQKFKTKLKAEWIQRILELTASSEDVEDQELHAWMIRLQKGVAEGITNAQVRKQWLKEDKKLKQEIKKLAKSERKEAQRGEKKQRSYVHLKFLPLEEMIDKIGGRKEDTHYEVRLSSLRLRTFKEHGTNCVKCGREGTHWGIDHHKTSPDSKPHMNLWSIVDDEQTLMTCDHIVPKSRGGKDTLDNTQTMCGPCNWNKGNQLEEEIEDFTKKVA